MPIDLSGHRSSGIAAMAYARLRQHLGLPARPIRVYDPVQQLAIVDEDVLERFQVDAIELGRAFAHEDKYWSEWVLPDGTPCYMPAWARPDRQDGEWVLRSSVTGKVIARMPAGVWYFEQANFPFLEHEDLDQLGGRVRRVHVVRRSPRRPGRLSPALTAPAVLAEGGAPAPPADRPRHHRPVRRQPAGDSASSSTATTTSSCSWPANPSAPTASWTS